MSSGKIGFKKVSFMFLILSIFASLSSAAAFAKSPDKLEVQDIVAYYQNSADFGAKEQLTKFNSLSQKKKERFVNLINDQAVMSQALDAFMNYKSDVTLADGDIVVSKTCSSGSEPVPQAREAAATTVWHSYATCTFDLGVLGITTSVTTRADFEENDLVVIRILGVSQSHVNWNPAVVISEIGTSSWTYGSEQNVFAEGRFDIAMSISGGAISHTGYQDINANIPGGYYYCSFTQ